MPAGQILYTFTIPGPFGPITYYVQVDLSTKTIFVDTNPLQDHPQTQVAEAALNGYKIGQVLRSFCEGTTFVKIIVSDFYPFAKFVNTINSPACGYIVPAACNFTLFDVLTTPETTAGLKNGTITINATLQDDAIEYSLDKINYQSLNVFKNLIPGIYFVTIRGVARHECTQTKRVLIAAGEVKPFVPYPWQEKVCKFFELVQDGIEYVISEPVKWDQVIIKGNRDKVYHGWKSQYSDGALELEFGCDQGKSLIETEYDLHGNDGETYFRYGYTYLNLKEILFDGKLNYNTYKKKRSTVTITTESKDFNDLFASRFDTKVALNEGKTQDGDFITVPSAQLIDLHGKALSTQFTVKNTSEYSYDYPVGLQGRAWIVPDTSEVITNEISESFPYSMFITDEAPYDIELENIRIKYKGVYRFAVHITIDIKTRSGLPIGVFTAFPYFMINDSRAIAGNQLQYPIGSADWVSNTINFSYFADVELSAGDNIYWFIEVNASAGVTGLSVTQRAVDIKIEALEEAQSSKASGWLIFDTINYLARNITNNRTFLKSNFLAYKSSQIALDGEGALNIFTNGKQIRKYNTADHPLKTSIKDAINTAKNIWCLGYGFETLGGSEFLRIERVPHFYQNKKILQIDLVISYDEEVARDLIFNEITYGYEKFLAEGLNVLDEYNTKHETLQPIRTHKAKIEILSPAISSGYSIEKSRRNQFVDTPTDSVENDEDLFIISVVRDGSDLRAEKNEAFDIVDNVISPSTAYNLRITPKRIELNWSVWVRNILHYKLVTDVLKTTFVTQNGKLKTKLKQTDQRAIGDIFKDIWTEDQEIQLGSYPVPERIFRPEYINIKANITPDKFIMVDLAMRGMYSSSIDYGYIVVKDNNGDYQAGFLMEISYNFYKEEVTMKLLKKWDSPVDPDEECCNYVTINGCRVLINGHKWKI